MCESEHEECDEARDTRFVGSQSRVLGQLECPLDRQRDGRRETLGTEELRGSRLLASNIVDAFGVTHLCRELQIGAGEDRRQRTRENCIDSGSHPVGGSATKPPSEPSIAAPEPAIRPESFRPKGDSHVKRCLELPVPARR